MPTSIHRLVVRRLLSIRRLPRANQRFDGVADVSSIPTAIPFTLTAASTTTVSDLTPFNDRIPSPPRRSRNSTTDAAAALVSLSISTEDSPADAVFQPHALYRR